MLKKRNVVLLVVSSLLALTVCGCVEEQAGANTSGWVDIFNGKDLEGWTPKISGHKFGEDPKRIFRVEDGLLKVSYDGYDKFAGQFGHLFYKDKFSHYKLRVEYRFVGEQIAGGPAWAFRNSGVMAHCQNPKTMRVDQPFPVCVEVQMLGGNGKDERATGNLCTPGTHVVIDGQIEKTHCINSSSKTYHGDQWVTMELEMHGNGIIKHIVNGEVVMQYSQPILDETDADAKELLKTQSPILSEGYFSLQAESHPLEFRKIQIKLHEECQGVQAVETQTKYDPEIYPGWKQSVQAYSFNRFTFYEAIDKAQSIGLKYIEAYPWQPLSKEHPKVQTGPDMPAKFRKQVKAKLAAADVKLINYGVVNLTNDEKQCRKVFDFAKDMGIETIVSEPPLEALDMIDKLCQEYKIKVALHNHPKPSIYYDPDTVLKACKGRSKWIGACADPGHWVRSGFDPVECLKKLEGKIISLHLKDVNVKSMDAHSVVWGEGVVNVEAVLKELHRQGFTGVMSNEYEYNWDNSLPDIKACIEYYTPIAGKLANEG